MDNYFPIEVFPVEILDSDGVIIMSSKYGSLEDAFVSTRNFIRENQNLIGEDFELRFPATNSAWNELSKKFLKKEKR